MRVSPPRISPVATRSSRPPADPPGPADAHRQSGFVLGGEIDLVVEGLNLEGAVAEASAGARFRKQPMVAAMGCWSRGWLGRLQALHAMEWGNYSAATGLVRMAADFQAAELSTLQTGAAEWQEWLDEPAIAMDAEEHGTVFRLHPFRAAEVLAADEDLAAVYRAASDLSMPHFGATLLVAASESTPERVLMTFGDRDFHVGFAEIVLGWLLELGRLRVRDLLERPGPYNVTGKEALRAWESRAGRTLVRGDRCRLHDAGDDRHRYVVSNWRRAPGAAPRRILL